MTDRTVTWWRGDRRNKVATEDLTNLVKMHRGHPYQCERVEWVTQYDGSRTPNIVWTTPCYVCGTRFLVVTGDRSWDETPPTKRCREHKRRSSTREAIEAEETLRLRYMRMR